MATEEARRIVRYYQSGSDGYASAIRALVDAYGQPQLIYPRHVKALLAQDSYTYDRRSLRRMRETLEINMRGIERVKGNTYEQLLAAIVMDRFDAQMRHEWTAFYSDSSKLPTIFEVLDFFRKREFSLPDEPSADASQGSKSSRLHNFPHKKHSHAVLKVNAASANTSCPVCSAEHGLHRCPVFLSYSVPKRQQVV